MMTHRNVAKLILGLVLHLVGWDGCESFLDQSQGKVKQNQLSNSFKITFDEQLKSALNLKSTPWFTLSLE